MANAIKEVCKNDKFIVLVEAGHASSYTACTQQTIKDISELLNEKSIFCKTFHIYEQNFFENAPCYAACTSAEYKLSDMQAKK